MSAVPKMLAQPQINIYFQCSSSLITDYKLWACRYTHDQCRTWLGLSFILSLRAECRQEEVGVGIFTLQTRPWVTGQPSHTGWNPYKTTVDCLDLFSWTFLQTTKNKQKLNRVMASDWLPVSETSFLCVNSCSDGNTATVAPLLKGVESTGETKEKWCQGRETSQKQRQMKGGKNKEGGETWHVDWWWTQEGEMKNKVWTEGMTAREEDTVRCEGSRQEARSVREI